MPLEATQIGENQRLPTHGRGVHQESGAPQASGGKTRSTLTKISEKREPN